MYRKKLLLFLVLIRGLLAFPSELNQDSLSNLNFQGLWDLFDDQYHNQKNGKQILDVCLQKAKQENDTFQMANAYVNLIDFDQAKNMQYADTLIAITKNIEGNKYFPTESYSGKAGVYLDCGNFPKALDYYLLALKQEEKTPYPIVKEVILYNIAIIKKLMGDYEGALAIIYRFTDGIKKSNRSDKIYHLSTGLFDLSDLYILNNKLDSAIITIEDGIKYTLHREDSILYAKYLIYAGKAYYNLNHKNQAIDSLIKALNIPFYEDEIAIAHLYMGTILYEKREFSKSLNHFIQVDSFLVQTQNVTKELLKVYPFLIELSAKNNNLSKQLHYTKNLIQMDSIYDAHYKYISEKIVKEYDIKKIIASKEQMIASLNQDKKRISNQFYLLLALLFSSVLIILLWYKSKNKKRTKIHVINTEKNKKVNKPQPIDNKAQETIMQRINAFEEKKQYIKKQYSLNELAKELNTNSSYLSKVINESKGLNFAQYINKVRVEYAVEIIKENEKIRSYTIKAIANEVGFNNAQSFSAAFEKYTGSKPSIFINEINTNN